MPGYQQGYVMNLKGSKVCFDSQSQEQSTAVCLVALGLVEADIIVRSTWQRKAVCLTVAGTEGGRRGWGKKRAQE